MKQNKTLIFAASALMIAATFVATPKVNADGLAPGEGYYAGAFMGFGTGILQAKITGLNANSKTFESERGGVGLSGIQGGIWAGYGMKTADDLYFGLEVTGLGSEEQIELTSSAPLASDDGTIGGNVSSIKVQRIWSAAPAVRVGYYVNKDTMFSLSGGVAVSSFDVDIGSFNETYYAGGPQMGTSVTTRLSKIDPNLSLRLQFVYTDYLTASVFNRASGNRSQDNTGKNRNDTKNELTGHDTAARVGVTYSF